MSRADFEEVVGEALDQVPAELLDMLENVVFLVEDEAPPGEHELLGLYEGVPRTERSEFAGAVLPDRITIFRLPTLRVCSSEQEVGDEVAITVVHEIAHHYGISEQRLRELGWG